ncbi:AlkA N-terminal domain-containing protein, partial [Vibrio cholerae]
FQSTRRFNDAFQKLFRLTPTQVRRERAALPSRNHLSLAFRGPFDWAHMLDFYRLRAIEGMELIDEQSYQRHFVLGEGTGWFKASMAQSHLDIEFEMERLSDLRHLVARLRRMFDLDADLISIEAHLEQLAPGLVRRTGIRIPGVWNAWEAGVRAVLGQQVSVKAAIGQLNLLVSTLAASEGSTRYFPTPEQVQMSDLSFLRMPERRKETL